jgi:CRP/FNR family transcriptional regulator, cyclic AMP receptor protein
MARVPLFSRLSKKELARIATLADEIDLPSGKVLAAEGARGREFFVLLEGTADVRQDTRPLPALGPGDFFGEIALLDGRPRTATVRADGITRVLVLGHREFRALMDEFPNVREAVMGVIAERLRRLDPGVS